MQHIQTERNLLESRLEHAERLRAVGTIASGVAHEFNNILGAIMGYAEIARSLVRRPSRTRGHIDQIILAGNRAKLIIEQILLLSRNRQCVTMPFDVSEIVMDLAPLLRVTVRADVQLNFKINEWQTVIEGSPSEIQQILMNLCKNASEALLNEGRVEVSVSRAHICRTRPLAQGTLTREITFSSPSATMAKESQVLYYRISSSPFLPRALASAGLDWVLQQWTAM
ncbi:hypothetical protein AJ88_47005 [Mesorhizobium amorphae CCBAU 01583]|nr:hypothetical protein AJ88_47005 [Mesorhizobium amorphae CCBAU 01583]